MQTWILVLIILPIATTMTMTGRGGGNFYVLAIALSGIEMHIAATTGQFVLIASALIATVFFGKKKVTDWKLVFLIGGMTLVSAFLGGFFSNIFEGSFLKIIFAVFIFIASILMFKPIKEEPKEKSKYRLGIKSGGITYHINLFIFIPVILIIGSISGMVGISGGSFLVPLMVLTVGVPMRIAIGTSTTLVMITATAGFLGHLTAGHFDPALAVPLAIAAGIGGFFGTKLTVNISPKKLKIIFAITSLLAAFIMVFRIYT